MTKWLGKGMLFLLGLILLFNQPVNAVAISALLVAFSAGCLSGCLRWRWAALIQTAVWAVLSWLFPVFAFFWPLMLYDILEKEWWVLGFIPPASVLLALSPSLQDTLLVLFGLVLAVFFWFSHTHLQRSQAQRFSAQDQVRQLERQLAETQVQLELARENSAKLAILDERGRIAREIHDTVGHILARSMMQTGALLVVNPDPAVAEGLTQLKETLNLAMNSVRESVHDLRDDSIDLYQTVTDSLADFSGYEINLNYDMEEPPHDVKACFTAVVQEGLANIAKHSNATRIQINLQEHPHFYKLALADNGTREVTGNLDRGMGLDNMRQRTQALGGQFFVKPPPGFSIHITIPKEEKS